MARRIGHFEHRGDATRLRVSVTDPVTKQRSQLTRTVPRRLSEAAANKALAAFYAEVTNGQVTPVSREHTVATACGEWLEHASARLQPNTATEAERTIRNHIVPYLGDVPLARLTTVQVDRHYAWLAREGALCRRRQRKCATYPCDHGGGGPLDPASIRKVHNLLVQSLDQAKRWRRVPPSWLNPAKLADPPSVRNRKPTAPEAERVRALLSAAAEEGGWLFVFLVLSSVLGGRRSETAALRWSDVDLESGQVWVTHKLIGSKDVAVLKTDASEGGVTIDAVVTGILRDYRAEEEASARLFGVELAADAYLFSCEPDRSAPMHTDSISREIARLRKRAGLLDVQLRNLRHFVGTEAARKFGARAAADRLRHADPNTSHRFYIAGRQADDVAVAEHLSELLLG